MAASAANSPYDYGKSHTRPGDRGASFTFVAILILSVPLLLYWGRSDWFGMDDWDFLALRNAGQVDDLFRGHYGHWTTIPIVIYRALFGLVGLHHYWPYQLVLIGLHLTAAFLLRVISCRAGVSPWLATLGATFFVFFGAGWENVLLSFQMTYVGALLFGLTQFILVDHEGPIDRRDAFGLFAGFVALMFSGVAVAMVAAVGLAALLRRGTLVAALQTVPLALIYFAWHHWSPPSENPVLISAPTFHSITSFMWVGFRAAFSKLGFVPVAGLLIFIITAGGVIQCWRSNRQDLIAPGALAFGAICFAFLVAWGRSGELQYLPFVLGPNHAATSRFEYAGTSRYMYVIVALLLPLMMVAFRALTVKWSWSQILILALFVQALVPNISLFVEHSSKSSTKLQGARLITAVPTLPGADQLPRSARPVKLWANPATVGWLLDNADKVPVTTLSPAEQAMLTKKLAKIRR